MALSLDRPSRRLTFVMLLAGLTLGIAGCKKKTPAAPAPTAQAVETAPVAKVPEVVQPLRSPDTRSKQPTSADAHVAPKPIDKTALRATLAADEKSCEAGDGAACVRAADTYGTVNKHIDEVFMAYLNHRACSGGALEACNKLGDLLEEGTPEVPGARSRFDDMCKHDNLNGCYALAGIEMGFYGGGQDMAAAEKKLRKLCDRGLGVACHDLAVFFAITAEGLPDVDAAVPLLIKSCEAGWPAACKALSGEE